MEDASAVTLRIKHVDLKEVSPMLGGDNMDARFDEILIEVEGKTRRGATVLRRLIENRKKWGPEIMADKVFSALTNKDDIYGVYAALDKYRMEWGVEAIETRVRMDIMNGHTRVKTIVDMFREHPRIMRILADILHGTMRKPDYPDAKALALLLEENDVECALVMCDRSKAHEFDAAWVICKIPEDVDDGDVTYIPGGNTGRWLRKYLSGNLESRWQTNCSTPVWLAIPLPGGCTGRNVTILPDKPDEWIGEEFNEEYDSECASEYEDEDELETVVTEVNVFGDLMRMCEAITDENDDAVFAVVKNDGTVLHRAPEMGDEEFKDALAITR